MIIKIDFYTKNDYQESYIIDMMVLSSSKPRIMTDKWQYEQTHDPHVVNPEGNFVIFDRPL